MTLITKLLVYLLSFAILDLMIPLPLAAGLLIYVVLQKPEWFHDVVKQLYHDKS
ncbi:MAG: hypothetical protein GY801_18550 [bacterium]|nr:hypothetical protein [bacterium]